MKCAFVGIAGMLRNQCPMTMKSAYAQYLIGSRSPIARSTARLSRLSTGPEQPQRCGGILVVAAPVNRSSSLVGHPPRRRLKVLPEHQWLNHCDRVQVLTFGTGKKVLREPWVSRGSRLLMRGISRFIRDARQGSH
jgi:hypothetical protein